MRLLDWEIDNPIIVSSGPFTNSKSQIDKMFSYGPGAVVTKTISAEELIGKHSIIKKSGYFFNREGYSDRSLEYWEDVFSEFSEKNLIANISGTTSSHICQLVKFCEKCGIKMIELGLSCPTLGMDPICTDLGRLEEICLAVRKRASVPLIAKIMISTSKSMNVKMVEVIKKTGIDAISVTDTLPALKYNEEGTAQYGGISGPFLEPMVMKFFQDVETIDISKIAIGGIETGQDVWDYLRSGSSAVEVCSVLLARGQEYLPYLINEYQEMEHKNKTT